MGLTGCRYAVVRHGDTVTGLGHVHIALNLVKPDGTRGSTVRDWPRAQQACAEIASDLGLVMPHKQSRHLNAEQRGRAADPRARRDRHPARAAPAHGRRAQRGHRRKDARGRATPPRGPLAQHQPRRPQGFSFSADDAADIWIAGGEIDASRRQVGQRLKANASQLQQEQQRQELSCDSGSPTSRRSPTS